VLIVNAEQHGHIHPFMRRSMAGVLPSRLSIAMVAVDVVLSVRPIWKGGIGKKMRHLVVGVGQATRSL